MEIFFRKIQKLEIGKTVVHKSNRFIGCLSGRSVHNNTDQCGAVAFSRSYQDASGSSGSTLTSADTALVISGGSRICHGKGTGEVSGTAGNIGGRYGIGSGSGNCPETVIADCCLHDQSQVVGTAPMLMLGAELVKMGCTPAFLLGARSSKDLLQLEYFEKLGKVYTTTEDGSMGEKGYVTQHSILHTDRFDMIYTCGPKPMMISVAKYAKVHGIECEVSLENRMACGVGACLCCVENTDEGHLCVCKEGPVFNIKKLLWQI